jgi:hypothetical protein
MVQRFSDIADEQMRDLGYEPVVKEWSAVWMWKDVVGSKLALVSRADRVKGHVLHVSVKNSSWAHQLSLMKAQILERINAALGEGALKDIKFSVTRFSQELSYKSDLSKWETEPDTAPHLDIDLSEDVLTEIRENASVIGDSRLRSLFERVQLADRKRKEWITRQGSCKCVACGVPVEASDICPVCAISRATNP